MKNPIVHINIKGGSAIKVELFPDQAPQTVRNFISLTKKGFYNGLAFWRIEKDYLIQGGNSNNKGTGTFDYAIKGEFESNGVKNQLKFTKGTIGMARLTPDSAGSDYFIVVNDTPQLDGNYAPFGRVIKGIEEATRISRGKSEAESFFHRAVNPVFVDTITVDTFGVDYPEPWKLPQLSKEENIAALEKTCRARGLDDAQIEKLKQQFEFE